MRKLVSVLKEKIRFIYKREKSEVLQNRRGLTLKTRKSSLLKSFKILHVFWISGEKYGV